MEGYRYQLEHRVIFRDVDVLGHVNNAVYATYFETARVNYMDEVGDREVSPIGIILAEITITYKSPAFRKETLVIGSRVTEMRNSSFIMEGRIEEKETGRLVATSRAVLVHYDYQENRPTPMPDHWRQMISRYEGREF